MSFIKNLLFGSYKTSEDPTGISGNNKDNADATDSGDAPIVEGIFYPRTLSKFNGHDNEKIFIAVRGKVYDCTQGRQFYGPSGPYSNFAGNDASRGLALNSFESETVREWDKSIDTLDDLKPEQKESLDSWESHFANKYPCVGTLVPEPGVNI
ncbi:hypothetical protein HG535_0A06350 [Zygotorulaspora mrakii]|uniref:Cytochrome b5 heme-binding domain-containing protein n=1 Tax=Zygotorulaspora mrakii TaxID=42260 RepID=A0A7H9AWU1_ZYGMR|nr:uncharacterized protein HG535_0A06350 [Zygotorulaspora mrakii]QLG70693.1 hypothetical protein HG535_0A06350 [Zygotorulaspora mrakii]